MVNKYLFIMVFVVMIAVANRNVFCFEFSSGARSAALSNSSIMLSDAWSTFHNQAGIAFLSNAQAGVSFENRFQVKELSVKSVTVVTPTKYASFGICYGHFGYSKYNESLLGVAVSRRFTDKFAVAIQFDYQKIQIIENENYIIFPELSLLSKPTEEISIGFQVSNPFMLKTNLLMQNRAPTIMCLGIGYVLGNTLLLTQIEKDLEQKPDAKFGLELKAIQNLFVRCGYALNSNQISFGMGYNWNKVLADFAFSHHVVLGYSPNVSLTYAF